MRPEKLRLNFQKVSDKLIKYNEEHPEFTGKVTIIFNFASGGVTSYEFLTQETKRFNCN